MEEQRFSFLFGRGMELFEAGEIQEAILAFEAALQAAQRDTGTDGGGDTACADVSTIEG